MSKYLDKAIIFFILLFLIHSGNLLNAQAEKVDIAIQQGHSDDIEVISISNDLKYFATYGKDNRLTVWDYRTGSQMAFRYTEEHISALSFDVNSTKLVLQSAVSGRLFYLEIETMLFSVENVPSVFFKKKEYCESSAFEVKIEEAKIILLNKQNGKTTKKTSDYLDQPFNSVLINNDNILAACEDGQIYIFNSKLKLIDQFKGHNSGVTDISISEDNRYLFSVSRDRSIIKWDLQTGTQMARYTGKSFPIYGLSLNQEGTNILFGDDVGF
jgi:WD40 repeat protein